MYVCMYTRTHKHTNKLTHRHTDTHTRTHIRTHTHTHTTSSTSSSTLSSTASSTATSTNASCTDNKSGPWNVASLPAPLSTTATTSANRSRTNDRRGRVPSLSIRTVGNNSTRNPKNASNHNCTTNCSQPLQPVKPLKFLPLAIGGDQTQHLLYRLLGFSLSLILSLSRASPFYKREVGKLSLISHIRGPASQHGQGGFLCHRKLIRNVVKMDCISGARRTMRLRVSPVCERERL